MPDNILLPILHYKRLHSPEFVLMRLSIFLQQNGKQQETKNLADEIAKISEAPASGN